MSNRFKYRIYSYGKANQAGLLTDFLFYAKLKQINDTGRLEEGSIHSTIESKIKMSRVQISTRLKSLIKNDFAKEIINHKTGKRIAIHLRSYRYVYVNLFNLHYNKSELYNITYKDIKDLKAQIVLLEQYHYEIEKEKLKERQSLNTKVDGKESDSSLEPIKSKVQPRSAEISCSIIASRLGYSNLMSGYRMKELARKKKYIRQNKVLFKHGFISTITDHWYNIKKDPKSLETIEKWLETGLLTDRRYFTVKEGSKIVLYERSVNKYDLKKLSLITQREKKEKEPSNEVKLIYELCEKYKDLTKEIFYNKYLDNKKSEPWKLVYLVINEKMSLKKFCPWF